MMISRNNFIGAVGRNSTFYFLFSRFWIVVFLLSTFYFLFSFTAFALERSIAPPLVNLVPRDLGSNEIWYIGGSAASPNAEVLIYLQSSSGETMSFTAKSDERGEWFYNHSGFLKQGRYKSWAQLRLGPELSPPSPEVAFEVLSTALQIGKYHLSYEGLYLALAVALFVALLASAAFLLYHFWHYHRKHARLSQEIREAEEEARRGFELLRKDLQKELAFVHRLRKSRELSTEEHRREAKLLADLDFVENHVLKEIQDIGPAIP